MLLMFFGKDFKKNVNLGLDIIKQYTQYKLYIISLQQVNHDQ